MRSAGGPHRRVRLGVIWEATGWTKVPLPAPACGRRRARFAGDRRLPRRAPSLSRSTAAGGCAPDQSRGAKQTWEPQRPIEPRALFFRRPRRGGARRPTSACDGIARGYGYLTLTGCDAASTAETPLHRPDSVDAHKGPCYPKSSRRSRQAAVRSGSVCRAETDRAPSFACFDGGLPPRANGRPASG